MASPDTPGSDKEVLSQSEVERLLAQVAEQDSTAVIHQADGTKTEQSKESIQSYDFRYPVFLSANEMRKLRVQHELIVQSLAARLSIYLRLEFGLQMSQFQTLTYQKFVEGLGNPCHLSLFKVEPLRGICILEMSPRLGLTIIDRLMGGPGHSVSANRDLSEIEMALLDQAIQLIISEWCNHWSKIHELHPVMLGHENTGRFLQTSQPDAVVLSLSMEARIGDCVEQIQIGFPYTALEPLIRGLGSKLLEAGDAPPVPATRPKWKREFDDVNVPVVADWHGLRLTARQLANLKVGDVISLPADFSSRIRVRIGQMPKFSGRLGTCDQQWAIELTGRL